MFELSRVEVAGLALLLFFSHFASPDDHGGGHGCLMAQTLMDLDLSRSAMILFVFKSVLPVAAAVTVGDGSTFAYYF